MAESPSHKWGQIIGDVLESALEPLLEEFAQKHALYLDKKGARGTRTGTKLTWQDLNKNSHDLDFVLERGGSATIIGVPVAFIELAWRRYTKHSRNKAQEIQGAILPLRETYRNHGPFIGVVLAGEFTSASLAQLKSLGFASVHFTYENVIEAFASEQIEASFDEVTSDSDFHKKIRLWKGLSKKRQERVEAALMKTGEEKLAAFMQDLATCVNRKLEVIRIFPLYGARTDLQTIEDAVAFLASYDLMSGASDFIRFEVQVKFSNEDRIEAVFSSSVDAITFLKSQQSRADETEGERLVRTVLDSK